METTAMAQKPKERVDDMNWKDHSLRLVKGCSYKIIESCQEGLCREFERRMLKWVLSYI